MNEEYAYLRHSVEEVDNSIDEVSDAIGDAQSLSARLAEKLDISDIDNALDTGSENPVQNKAVSSAVSALMDSGAKNQLMNNAVTGTVNGITFTVNTDGTFTANGTATATAILILNTFSNLALASGNYILTGCPEGGSLSSYRLDITRTPEPSIDDIGNGASFAVGSSYTLSEIRCVILKDTVCDNLSFKPMIRRAELPAGYQPYAPTNRQLHEAKATVEGIYGQGIEMTSASSFNNYLIPGVFYAYNAVANTLADGPFSIGNNHVRLEVTSIGLSTMQTLYIASSLYDGQYFKRRRSSSGVWGNWYKFQGEALQSTAQLMASSDSEEAK